MDSYTDTPTIVDLFSGCGGFSLGAELAGFRSIAAIDVDSTLQSSFGKNFPKAKPIQGNVADIVKSDWVQLIGNTRPTGIIGGPPCQGFSRIGKREKLDPRNDLIHHYYRHVKELSPKFFVMENVQGLLDNQNIETLMNGIEQVSGKYNILGPFVVNAANFGAATNRHRVVVIGYDPNEMDPLSIEEFSPSKLLKPTTIKDAIYDLPGPIADPKNNLDYGWAHYPSMDGRKLSSYAKKMRKLPPSGLGWSESIKKLKNGYLSGLVETKHTDIVTARYASTECGKADPVSKSYKLHWEGLSPTLRAGTGSDKGSFQAVRPLHPSEGRVITVREAARIQGFPDWFVFHQTKWHSFRMIGNSVSPLMSEGLLTPIFKNITAQKNEYAA
ncbi:DNA cytosine methyltransferase [Pseudomonas sp. RL_35y_Pfl2_P42]|uniref:DNA cytosine methyltransferase n=1 Tax=Pseudomonas sp. RL_35y_Pfl2_P42 TaxID=3088710 RepID=UPI0030DCE8E7